MDIQVFEDYEKLSLAGARLFMERANASIAKRGLFFVALSGGSTPKRMYELLSQQQDVNWQKIHFYQSDERDVPENDPASNFKMINEAFFSKLKIPEENIHRIKTELGSAKAAE